MKHTWLNDLLNDALKLVFYSDYLYFSENQISGLDEDEAHFLDFVSDRKQEITKAREDEESEVLREYRVSFLLIISSTFNNSFRFLFNNAHACLSFAESCHNYTVHLSPFNLL